MSNKLHRYEAELQRLKGEIDAFVAEHDRFLVLSDVESHLGAIYVCTRFFVKGAAICGNEIDDELNVPKTVAVAIGPLMGSEVAYVLEQVPLADMRMIADFVAEHRGGLLVHRVRNWEDLAYSPSTCCLEFVHYFSDCAIPTVVARDMALAKI